MESVVLEKTLVTRVVQANKNPENLFNFQGLQIINY